MMPLKIKNYGILSVIFTLLFMSMPVFSAAKNDSPPVYYFGIPPYQKGQSIDEIRSLYKPMLLWLGKKVGVEFKFIGAGSYEKMIELVASGKVQLAGLGPVPFIEAKQQNPRIRLLLTELKWNDSKTAKVDSYTGYILALKTQKEINSLADMKGKPFAFVNHHSTSGFKYPNALLREKGIIPKSYFSKVYFLGSHPRVTDAIVAGSIKAGATWDFNWNRAKEKHGDIFKVIFQTPPIPNLTLVSHPSLPSKIADKIQKILPTIDPELLKGLPMVGFAVRPESYYDDMKLLK